MRIGVIKRSHHGEQTAKEAEKYFDVVVFEIPETVPEILEDPDFESEFCFEDFIDFPEGLLSSDLIISYAGHPEINMELIKKAKGTVFITGKGGSRSQLKKLANRYGTKLVLADICCNSPEVDDKFFKIFGRPSFEVRIENGTIEDVKVIRGAFCGASNFVAENINGMRIEDAPSKAGYYTQVFPCLASRGINGKIHLAAKIHKDAVDKAIKKALKNE